MPSPRCSVTQPVPKVCITHFPPAGGPESRAGWAEVRRGSPPSPRPRVPRLASHPLQSEKTGEPLASQKTGLWHSSLRTALCSPAGAGQASGPPKRPRKTAWQRGLKGALAARAPPPTRRLAPCRREAAAWNGTQGRAGATVADQEACSGRREAHGGPRDGGQGVGTPSPGCTEGPRTNAACVQVPTWAIPHTCVLGNHSLRQGGARSPSRRCLV